MIPNNLSSISLDFFDQFLNEDDLLGIDQISDAASDISLSNLESLIQNRDRCKIIENINNNEIGYHHFLEKDYLIDLIFILSETPNAMNNPVDQEAETKVWQEILPVLFEFQLNKIKLLYSQFSEKQQIHFTRKLQEFILKNKCRQLEIYEQCMFGLNKNKFLINVNELNPTLDRLLIFFIKIVHLEKNYSPIINNADSNKVGLNLTFKFFAGFTADSFITNIKGIDEGFNHIDALECIKKTYELTLSPNAEDPFIIDLNKMLYWAEKINLVRQDKSIKQNLEKISNDILDTLKKEHSIVLLGSLGAYGSGHSVIYQILLNTDSTYTFRVYNSGAGIEYHSSCLINGKEICMPFYEIDNISEEKLSIQFLSLLIGFGSSKKRATENFLTDYLYRGILSTLGGNVNYFDHSFIKNIGLTPQKSGTCSLKSILAFMKCRFKNDDYKIIKHRMIMMMFRDYIPNRLNTPLSRQEKKIIVCALKNHIASIQKLCIHQIVPVEYLFDDFCTLKNLLLNVKSKRIAKPIKSIDHLSTLPYQINSKKFTDSDSLNTSHSKLEISQPIVINFKSFDKIIQNNYENNVYKCSFSEIKALFMENKDNISTYSYHKIIRNALPPLEEKESSHWENFSTNELNFIAGQLEKIILKTDPSNELENENLIVSCFYFYAILDKIFKIDIKKSKKSKLKTIDQYFFGGNELINILKKEIIIVNLTTNSYKCLVQIFNYYKKFNVENNIFEIKFQPGSSYLDFSQINSVSSNITDPKLIFLDSFKKVNYIESFLKPTSISRIFSHLWKSYINLHLIFSEDKKFTLKKEANENKLLILRKNCGSEKPLLNLEQQLPNFHCFEKSGKNFSENTNLIKNSIAYNQLNISDERIQYIIDFSKLSYHSNLYTFAFFDLLSNYNDFIQKELSFKEFCVLIKNPLRFEPTLGKRYIDLFDNDHYETLILYIIEFYKKKLALKKLDNYIAANFIEIFKVILILRKTSADIFDQKFCNLFDIVLDHVAVAKESNLIISILSTILKYDKNFISDLDKITTYAKAQFIYHSIKPNNEDDEVKNIFTSLSSLILGSLTDELKKMIVTKTFFCFDNSPVNNIKHFNNSILVNDHYLFNFNTFQVTDQKNAIIELTLENKLNENLLSDAGRYIFKGFQNLKFKQKISGSNFMESLCGNFRFCNEADKYPFWMISGDALRQIIERKMESSIPGSLLHFFHETSFKVDLLPNMQPNELIYCDTSNKFEINLKLFVIRIFENGTSNNKKDVYIRDLRNGNYLIPGTNYENTFTAFENTFNFSPCIEINEDGKVLSIRALEKKTETCFLLQEKKWEPVKFPGYFYNQQETEFHFIDSSNYCCLFNNQSNEKILFVNLKNLYASANNKIFQIDFSNPEDIEDPTSCLVLSLLYLNNKKFDKSIKILKKIPENFVFDKLVYEVIFNVIGDHALTLPWEIAIRCHLAVFYHRHNKFINKANINSCFLNIFNSYANTLENIECKFRLNKQNLSFMVNYIFKIYKNKPNKIRNLTHFFHSSTSEHSMVFQTKEIIEISLESLSLLAQNEKREYLDRYSIVSTQLLKKINLNNITGLSYLSESNAHNIELTFFILLLRFLEKNNVDDCKYLLTFYRICHLRNPKNNFQYSYLFLLYLIENLDFTNNLLKEKPIRNLLNKQKYLSVECKALISVYNDYFFKAIALMNDSPTFLTGHQSFLNVSMENITEKKIFPVKEENDIFSLSAFKWLERLERSAFIQSCNNLLKDIINKEIGSCLNIHSTTPLSLVSDHFLIKQTRIVNFSNDKFPPSTFAKNTHLGNKFFNEIIDRMQKQWDSCYSEDYYSLKPEFSINDLNKALIEAKNIGQQFISNFENEINFLLQIFINNFKHQPATNALMTNYFLNQTGKLTERGIVHDLDSLLDLIQHCNNLSPILFQILGYYLRVKLALRDVEKIVTICDEMTDNEINIQSIARLLNKNIEIATLEDLKIQLFSYKLEISLSEKQMSLTKQRHSSVKLAIQGECGLGKTKVLTPLWSMLESQSKINTGINSEARLVIVIVRSNDFEMNYLDLKKAIEPNFHRSVVPFRFERLKDFNDLDLTNLLFLDFQKHCSNGNIVITTKQDIQSLFLSVIEYGQTKSPKASFADLINLASLIFYRGKFFGDELDEIVNMNEFLNFALDKTTKMPPFRYEIQGAILAELTGLLENASCMKQNYVKLLPNFISSFVANNTHLFGIEYKEKEKKYLEKYLLYGVNDDNCLDELENWFKEKEDRFKDKVLLARAHFHLYVPNALSQTLFIHYGPSDKHLRATHYNGNMGPSGAEYAHFDYLINLTTLMYLQLGMSHEQVLSYLSYKAGGDLSASEGKQLILKNEVKKITGKHLSSFIQTNEREQLTVEMLNLLKNNHSIILDYLNSIVFPKITVQVERLSSSAHDIGYTLTRDMIGFSATLNNHSTISPCFEFLFDNSDVNLLKDYFDDDVCQINVLKGNEVWQNWIIDPKITSFADPTGMHKGKTTLEIGQEILNLRPDIDYVTLYDSNNKRKMLNRKGLLVPFNDSYIYRNKVFTLFDQIHTTGSDITQHPQARMALGIDSQNGQKITLTNLTQTIGRNRMRGKDKQSVEIFITENVINEIEHLMNEKLGDNQTILKNQLFTWSLHSESEILPNTFTSSCFLYLDAIFKKQAWRKILNGKADTDVIKKYRSLFIEGADIESFRKDGALEDKQSFVTALKKKQENLSFLFPELISNELQDQLILFLKKVENYLSNAQNQRIKKRDFESVQIQKENVCSQEKIKEFLFAKARTLPIYLWKAWDPSEALSKISENFAELKNKSEWIEVEKNLRIRKISTLLKWDFFSPRLFATEGFYKTFDYLFTNNMDDDQLQTKFFKRAQFLIEIKRNKKSCYLMIGVEEAELIKNWLLNIPEQLKDRFINDENNIILRSRLGTAIDALSPSKPISNTILGQFQLINTSNGYDPIVLTAMRHWLIKKDIPLLDVESFYRELRERRMIYLERGLDYYQTKMYSFFSELRNYKKSALGKRQIDELRIDDNNIKRIKEK